MEEPRERRSVDGLRNVGTTHVVDDDARLERSKEVPALVEIGGFKVDDDVPAEGRDLLHYAVVVLVGFGVDETTDVVEANPANSALVHLLEFVDAHLGPDAGDPSAAIIRGREDVEHGRVVVAVTGGLDDHVFLDAEKVTKL